MQEKLNHLDKTIDSLNITLNKDIERLEQRYTFVENRIGELKDEIWELKSNIKKIYQTEKDVVQISEQINSLKLEFEAKMVTKTDLYEKKYKDVNLWIAIIALVATLLFNYDKVISFTQNLKGNQENVLSDNKK